ncbi:MAG: archease, partial [Gammaproteobacteria bacterium]
MTANTIRPRWEHFDHDADIGIRGTAATPDQAFEQAAFAMMALITDPATVTGSRSVPICCRES